MIVFHNSKYACGKALPGRQGKDGQPGENSNCIYYVPVDLRTSNNVEFALNRIKNNQLFDLENVNKLPDGLEYTYADYFYTCTGDMFKLNLDYSGFIHIGKVNEVNTVIKSVNIKHTSDSSVLEFDADFDNYYYVVYNSDKKLCPLSGYITKKSEASNIKVGGLKYSDLLIKCVSKSTGNFKMIKIKNE